MIGITKYYLDDDKENGDDGEEENGDDNGDTPSDSEEKSD